MQAPRAHLKVGVEGEVEVAEALELAEAGGHPCEGVVSQVQCCQPRQPVQGRKVAEAGLVPVATTEIHALCRAPLLLFM